MGLDNNSTSNPNPSDPHKYKSLGLQKIVTIKIVTKKIVTWLVDVNIDETHLGAKLTIGAAEI